MVKLSNTVVLGISKSKLDNSILSSETNVDNYNTLCCDWNKHGEGMAYSIHGHISYILEANSKRPIRKKRKEINKVVLKRLNGLTL